MIHNKIQFAVVREDPEIESYLIQNRSIESVLMIASGGCTAFSLKLLHPHIKITLLDPNLGQIDLIKKKVHHLQQKSEKKLWNIENSSLGLNQCGNFESIFRGLREFIWDLVTSKKDLDSIFRNPAYPKSELLKKMFANKYWPVAFDLFFCDSILDTMFGKEATQNAPDGTYPRYFQQVIERGLLQDFAFNNYFLHHILLGCYIDRFEALPYYLRECFYGQISKLNFSYFQGFLEDMKNISSFDLIHLSNIYDWMSEEEQKKLATVLVKNMKKGSTLLIRQLNNQKDVKAFFSSHFSFDSKLEKALLAKDRSLFYSTLNIGSKGE